MNRKERSSNEQLRMKSIVSIIIFAGLFLSAWLLDTGMIRFHFIDNEQDMVHFQQMNVENQRHPYILYSDFGEQQDLEATSMKRMLIPPFKPREYIRIYHSQFE